MADEAGSLAGKVAVVTGAEAGIDRASAHALAAQGGASVAVIDIDGAAAETGARDRPGRWACHTVAALQRVVEIADSPAFGLEHCLGTTSEMGGEAAVLEAITVFGPAGRIVYVHFRDVQGMVPHGQEAFPGGKGITAP